jgi:hypothetical protein
MLQMFHLDVSKVDRVLYCNGPLAGGRGRDGTWCRPQQRSSRLGMRRRQRGKGWGAALHGVAGACEGGAARVHQR